MNSTPPLPLFLATLFAFAENWNRDGMRAHRSTIFAWKVDRSYLCKCKGQNYLVQETSIGKRGVHAMWGSSQRGVRPTDGGHTGGLTLREVRGCASPAGLRTSSRFRASSSRARCVGLHCCNPPLLPSVPAKFVIGLPLCQTCLGSMAGHQWGCKG